MPDDAPRCRLTIADLKPTTRIAYPPQRPLPRPVKPPRAVKAPSATPKGPPKAAKPPVVLPQPATAYVPRAIERDADGFPCGWAYERHSWGFHRLLWREYGIRLELGEFTAIVPQCRNGTGEWLDRNIWRVTLRSGRQIIVAVDNQWQPLTVLPGDWQAHTGWAYALLHIPKPEPVPRLPRARPSKDTQQ